MTAKVTMNCKMGGRSVITLNICAQRAGSNNDRSIWRVVRRASGFTDVPLRGEAHFVLSADRDVRSWTWIDDGVPHEGHVDYVLQINRQEGTGTVYELVLLGQHFKR